MSRAGYEAFSGFCDLYLAFLQTILFLVIWDIFFGLERGKGKRFLRGFLQWSTCLCACARMFRVGEGMWHRRQSY